MLVLSRTLLLCKAGAGGGVSVRSLGGLGLAHRPGVAAARLVAATAWREPVTATAHAPAARLHTSQPATATDQKLVQTPYGEAMPSNRAHWNAERILAVSLLGVIPLAFNYPSFAMDMVLSTGVLLHAHWGMVGVGSDYGKFLPTSLLPKLVAPAIYTASALAFACLCYFNYNDIGVAMAIRTFWTLG